MVATGMNVFLLKDAQGSNSYPLSSQRSLVLGREDDCDIVIDEKLYNGVSRHHAKLQQAGNSWQICDLNSANGTYVNRRRIQGCQQLSDSDRIQLDQYGPTFIFEAQGGNSQTATANPQGAVRTVYNPKAHQANNSTPPGGNGMSSLTDQIPWKVNGSVVAAVAALYFVTRPQPIPITPQGNNPPAPIAPTILQGNNPPSPITPSPNTSSGGTFANGLFTLQLPANSQLGENNSQPGKSVDISWKSDTIPYVNVTIEGGFNQTSADALARALQAQLQKWYGQKDNFGLAEPKIVNTNSAINAFSFNTTGGKRLGLARILQNGDKVGIVLVVIPDAQADQLADTVSAIAKSFDINSSVQMP
jgi:hypothetical protein